MRMVADPQYTPLDQARYRIFDDDESLVAEYEDFAQAYEDFVAMAPAGYTEGAGPFPYTWVHITLDEHAAHLRSRGWSEAKIAEHVDPLRRADAERVRRWQLKSGSRA